MFLWPTSPTCWTSPGGPGRSRRCTISPRSRWRSSPGAVPAGPGDDRRARDRGSGGVQASAGGHRLTATGRGVGSLCRVTRTRGRPRRNPGSPTGLGSEQDILHAAGELFVTKGFGRTSTRAIAEGAGLQQASVYHWFSSKDEILLRLVLGTVIPSHRIADRLLESDAPGHVLLWALAYADARLLHEDPQNLGVLYFEPALDGDHFSEFHEVRDSLHEAYRVLLERTTGERATDVDVAMVVGLVENVITYRRRTRSPIPDDTPARVADAALTLARVPDLLTDETRARGTENLAALDPPGPGSVD
nr:TetR/AcrR family transcriptional regulator [Dietzia sp. DQ11-38-2]